MGRLFALVGFLTVAAAGALPDPASAQSASPMAGVWTLNRPLSEFPRDIGFNPSWMTTPTGDGRSAGSTGGARGRRGSGGGGSNGGATVPSAARPESYEDARRVQLLTAEVRSPAARLIIVDTPAAVTMT